MVPQYLALKMITRNLERAFFPVFGILIGVASIVIILSISAGGRVIIENDLNYMGENRIVVTSEKPNLRDIEYLETLPFVDYAVPQNSGYTDKERGVTIFGLTKKARIAKGIQSELGRNQILMDTNEKNIQINIYGKNQWLNVVGTYEEKNPLRKINDQKFAVVDIRTLEDYLEATALSKGIIIASETGDEATILLALNRFNPAAKYEIVEGAAAFNFVNKIKKTLGTFLITLGGVATILGGISISNLMASQIQKRKGTIGMLMSLGADNKFIFKMFLTEATLLSALGAVAGGVLGTIISILLGNAIGIPPILDSQLIIFVIILAIFMGAVFGVIPAKMASNLNPAIAIKSSD
ncbi:MAG: ABC transporter permease [Fusobacteriaceae bacterium]